MVSSGPAAPSFVPVVPTSMGGLRCAGNQQVSSPASTWGFSMSTENVVKLIYSHQSYSSPRRYPVMGHSLRHLYSQDAPGKQTSSSPSLPLLRDEQSYSAAITFINLGPKSAASTAPCVCCCLLLGSRSWEKMSIYPSCKSSLLPSGRHGVLIHF